jgi:hypothetical protein
VKVKGRVKRKGRTERRRFMGNLDVEIQTSVNDLDPGKHTSRFTSL